MSLCWAHTQPSEEESLAIFGWVERLHSVGCSVRSRDGEKNCLRVCVSVSVCACVCVCVCGDFVLDKSVNLCCRERFFYRVQSYNKRGRDSVEKWWKYSGSWSGGGEVFKLIWSRMPQRHGRCDLATHPDRNLSRLHHCFVFQINWPLKIALRPSQHYWCTFSSPQLKVCTPHAALSPRSQWLLAPLVTENKLGFHIRAYQDCGVKEQLKAQLYNPSVWV